MRRPGSTGRVEAAMKQLFCECGAGIRIHPGLGLGSDDDLLATWETRHTGPGHGRCSANEANLIRNQRTRGALRPPASTRSGGQRVSSAWRFANDNVMVYADDGGQIFELQGPYTPELHSAIQARADDRTEWRGFPPAAALVWR